MPDDVAFVAVNSTHRDRQDFKKQHCAEQFRDYVLSTEAAQ